MITVTGDEFALQAQSDKYTGVPYSKLDCQGFVEAVLKDSGVRKTDGSPYNWKGSNSMWRNALSWKGTIFECVSKFGHIPLGAWAFIVRDDGGEIERGYHDNEGNATHVGIYCREGEEPIRDSTRTSSRDGVGYRSLKSFTHIGLPKMVIFEKPLSEPSNIMEAIRTIRNPDATDSEFLDALETLTKHLKGV